MDILGLGEIRWPGEVKTLNKDYKSISKGGQTKRVAFIYKKSPDKNVMKMVLKSEEVETLIIQG